MLKKAPQVLETRFETRDGAVLLIDLYASAQRTLEPRPHCCRVARSRTDAFRIGRPLRLRRHGTLGASPGGRHPAGDRGTRPSRATRASTLHGKDLTTVGKFLVPEGDVIPFTLTYAPSHLPPPDPVDPRGRSPQAPAYLLWRRFSPGFDLCRCGGRPIELTTS
jgi:hypothetical protein